MKQKCNSLLIGAVFLVGAMLFMGCPSGNDDGDDGDLVLTFTKNSWDGGWNYQIEVPGLISSVEKDKKYQLVLEGTFNVGIPQGLYIVLRNEADGKAISTGVSSKTTPIPANTTYKENFIFTADANAAGGIKVAIATGGSDDAAAPKGVPTFTGNIEMTSYNLPAGGFTFSTAPSGPGVKKDGKEFDSKEDWDAANIEFTADSGSIPAATPFNSVSQGNTLEFFIYLPGNASYEGDFEAKAGIQSGESWIWQDLKSGSGADTIPLSFTVSGDYRQATGTVVIPAAASDADFSKLQQVTITLAGKANNYNGEFAVKLAGKK